MEFGFRSRNGPHARAHPHGRRRTSRIADPAAAIELVRGVHLELGGQYPTEQPDERYLAFLRVLLERLRTRGGLGHRWLDRYLDEAGTSRFQIWGGRPPGMRAFPRGVAAPRFLLAQPKKRSEFDVAAGRLSWYEGWAQRCLQITREQAPELWNRLLPELAAAGLLAARHRRRRSARVYGLQPGHIEVRLLTDDEAPTPRSCAAPCAPGSTPCTPDHYEQWHGQPCPSYRCRTGRLVAGTRLAQLGVHHRDRDFRHDYYRRLYRQRRHLPDRHRRAHRPAHPPATGTGGGGVQGRHAGSATRTCSSCTPTLEMGIDIGDLSAVVLAALPPAPANYVQQVGPGRAAHRQRVPAHDPRPQPPRPVLPRRAARR